MKKLVMLLGALAVSSTGFANVQSDTTANALGSAWKAQQTMHALQNQHDIAIVYGGEDISARPTLIEKTTTT